jgi:predicted RNase H-like HicB family nuclease
VNFRRDVHRRVYRAENGDIVAYLEGLPGASGQGATEADAAEALREAAEVILAARVAWARGLVLLCHIDTGWFC